MFLLDTNVVSELRRARPHGGVLAWVASVADDDLYLSAVTIGEIQTGIERTRANNPVKAAELEQWADEIVASYRTIPMTADIFRLWARLMHRHPGDHVNDAMIAATALTHDLIVVTRNSRDFVRFDVEQFDPFAPRPH